jgi:hypothetical protein
MKTLLRALGHAAIGGFAAGLATVGSGPITIKTALLPAFASAVTSVISLFAMSPRDVK